MTIIKSYIVTNAAASQSGGSGSVTSFSSGNLSPLFTSSVATPTTTPALTFSAVNQNANLVYAGPATGAAAAPTFRALVAADLPSDSGAYIKTAGTSSLTALTVVDGAFDMVFANDRTLFTDNVLGVYNPNADFYYTFNSSAIVANRIITLPLLTSDDTLVTAAFGQTLTNKTLGSGTVFSVIPTISDGIKFTFNPNATVSGLNVGAHTADPSAPVNGDVFYNSTTNKFRIRENGAWVSMTGFWSLNNDFTIDPSVGTTVSAFVETGDQLRFLPASGGDQVGSIAFGLPGNTFAQWEISSQVIRIHTRSSGFESINLSETQSNFYASDGVTNSSLRLTGTTATITGTLATFAGLQAAADYSANFTARSYIDKGYADATYEPAFTVLGPASGGTGVANNAASTLTISGNFATTLTVTGPTGVTLPTTGTLATLAEAEQFTNKTLDSGTVFSAAPTINDGITFTFNPDATNAGLNFGVHAGDPTNGGTNGNAWYNSTTGSLNVGKNNIVQSVITSAALTSITGRVPFISSSSNVVTYSANFQFTTNRLFGTTLYLTLSAGTATAGTCPFVMTTGTLLTAAIAGGVEYNNTFHMTNSDATRRHVVLAPNTTKVTAGAPYANSGYVVMNVGGTDFNVMVTG